MITVLTLTLAALAQDGADHGHLEGVLVGEPSDTGAWIQTRLTASEGEPGSPPPGRNGVVRFEVCHDPGFPEGQVMRTALLPAVEESDHIVRARLNGLSPDSPVHWRVFSGADADHLTPGPRGSFRTSPGLEGAGAVSFCVVTGMNQNKFLNGYKGEDKGLGFPGLASMAALDPSFVVFTGDNVYYDHPREPAAKTRDELRAKWHVQFAQPRMIDLFARTATFWMKDDHDHRFNDCDNTGKRLPSSQLGIDTFIEQVPVSTPTWRTHRVSRDLQVWLVEGRDHRSPNSMDDGPDKSLWGSEQLAWLKRTLLESDARHLVLLSPTPLVGPDDAYKRDNHTNPKGFRHEGDAFLDWIVEEGLLERFVVVCGDRHWQYRSVHPTGVEEYSCGALVDANSRLGRKPGDPKSTDPDALVEQPYVSRKASGGFLEVRTEPSGDGGPAGLHFVFRDEFGVELYSTSR